MNVSEDTTFSDRVQELLGVDFIRYPLATHNRFFVLRGQSQYAHMSMCGGQSPLDTSPGEIAIEPVDIQDERLRFHRDRLIQEHQRDVTPILSICVSLKNRSCIRYEGRELQLFPNCVRSLAEAARTLGPVELIVADFQSDDWPLAEWLEHTAAPLQVRVIPVEGDFSRGRGLNLAARQARSDRLFRCDADMLVPAELLRRGVEIVDAGEAYFPIFGYLGPDGTRRHEVPESYGIAVVARSTFEAAGGVPEFHSWGGEDNLFHDAVARQRTVCRESVAGFDHQWHPEWCRHQYYRNACRQDYNDHVAAR